ncbi:MAG: sugar ABC transporter permease [Trueperaceae bacterium]|nr:sugar ABC transporter permease [Trueperaceae bacterium]
MNIVTQTPAVKQKKSLGQRLYKYYNSQAFVALLFLIIPVGLLIILKIYPIFYNLYLSFTRYELFEPPRFVGLRNYKWVFQNDVTRQSIWNTLLFTIEAVPLGTALALVVAKLLDENFYGKIMYRTLYYLPVISSIVVSAMIFRWIFNPQQGLLNYFLGFIGIPPQTWLSDPNLALLSLVMVTIWGSIGGNMIIFLAGLQDIPKEVLEAAKVDGANAFQRFIQITIPLLRPVILFVVVTFTISTFRNFGLIFLLTQGGPLNRTNTLVWEVYMSVFANLRLGRGAALSMVMLVMVFILTILSFRVIRERQG